MHVYRDTASIHDAHAKALGSELGELLGRNIEELLRSLTHDACLGYRFAGYIF